MGVNYTVACKDHRVKRDLNNIKLDSIKNYDDACKFSEKLENKQLYSESLLLSFMEEHCGCDVVFFSEEHYEMVSRTESFDDDGEYWGNNL